MRYSFAVWLALCPSVVWGATFGIDFDHGTLGTQLPVFTSAMEGKPPLPSTADLSTSFSIGNTYPDAFGPSRSLRFQFAGNRRRNRGTLSGPFAAQSALLGDYWGAFATSTFTIDLWLPSGEFSLTTFHHDEVSGTTGSLTITDANGVHDPLAVVETMGDAPLAIGQLSTTIESDGITNVRLRFSAPNSEMGINGLLLEELIATPEPGSLAPWCGILIALIAYASRRMCKPGITLIPAIVRR